MRIANRSRGRHEIPRRRAHEILSQLQRIKRGQASKPEKMDQKQALTMFYEFPGIGA